MKRIVGFLAAGHLVAASGAGQDWSLESPRGIVRVSVRLAESPGGAGESAGGRLTYRLEQGLEWERAVLLNDSPLGLRLRGQDFVDGLRFEAARGPTRVESDYQLVHGKRHACYNEGKALVLAFRNAQGQPLELELRAYDDGVAYRYRLPGGDDAVRTLESEATGFAVPAEARLWAAPCDKPGTYAPAYETYYEDGMATGTRSSLGFGWGFPLLYRTAQGRWGLITESDVGPEYCGSRLAEADAAGVYRVALPDAAEGNGQGAVEPSWKGAWQTPWRVVIVGGALGTIVESTLVTDVAAPSRVADTAWIRPGRVAWSWWSDPPSPQDGAKQRLFIDFAAEMGWEYVLVDANWTIMDHGTIHDVLRHAQAKGVGVLLWYNSGGPHNVVTEKPRDSLTYREVRRFELDLLRKWGVKGVKVDFFQSDKQDIMALYRGILEDAAEHRILVNFHGCTLPRGWERTFPNLMSMEAIRGAECYIFDEQFPRRAPVQNTITPFTRNVVGPMDYTPVAFSDNRYPHLTTCAHELALGVLFESGWVHFADKPEAYLGLPTEPKELLKQLPVTWDDIRFVDGYPGQFVVLARRKGETWYVAGVNGRNQPRELRVCPGSWLAAGARQLTLIADGNEARSFGVATRPFQSGEEFAVRLLPHGGFVATLAPAR